MGGSEPPSPLVVVTRDAARSAPLVAALEAVGMRVMVRPLTEIHDLPVSFSGDMRAYEWLLVTSASTAARLARIGAVPDSMRVAAVGAATADALRTRGVRVDVIADRPTGKALGKAILDVDPGPARALLPVARDAGASLCDVLETAGWGIDRLELYVSEPVVVPAEEGAALVAADVVVLAAPSASAVWADVLSTAQVRGRGPAIVAIGTTTAAAVDGLGIGPAVVAEAPTTDGLVAAVLRALKHA